MALILLCEEVIEPTASAVTCVRNGKMCHIILQGQEELSTEYVYLTQPPWAILGMVGDGAMTLSTVYNFCFETNNYYQDKKIIYIVSRACGRPSHALVQDC